ncbi:MAG: outer-membrane lipoprotein carrier protein LolA [Pseudomonadota bacterium]
MTATLARRGVVAALLVLGAAALQPVVTSGGFAQAGFDGSPWVQQANATLNGMQAVNGQFVQIGPNGERSEGDFYLRRPGLLRFEYAPPAEIEVISNGRWVAIQDHKLRTTQRYPLSSTPLSVILAEQVDLTRDARVLDVYEAGSFVTITLESRASDATGNVVLMFDTQTRALLQWTVTDAQGLETSVAINNVQVGVPNDPALFRINDYIDVDEYNTR